MASVAAIIFGGTAMAIKYIRSADAIYGTAYGVMTSAKVGLLLMLLALGGSNYLLVEELRRDPRTPILRLKRFAEVEIGIGLTVLFAAASLTSLPPGVDLAGDRLNWQEIAERATPQWPLRLTSPDHDRLTISQLQGKIAATEEQRTRAPLAYVPGEGTILPRNAEDIACLGWPPSCSSAPMSRPGHSGRPAFSRRFAIRKWRSIVSSCCSSPCSACLNGAYECAATTLGQRPWYFL